MGFGNGHRSSKGTEVPYRRLNRFLLKASSKELTNGQKAAAVTIVTSIVVLSSIIGLYNGVNVIFPHFFYLPIIMAAYWFPHKGVAFSIALGLLYTSEFVIFGLILETIPRSEWILVVSRSIVFVVVGTVLTMLRWEGFTLNRIIGDQDKFVFLLDRDLGYFYYSPSAYHMLRGSGKEDAFAEGIKSLVSTADRPGFDDAERRALSGERVEEEFNVQDDDDVRTYSFCFIPLLKGDMVYGYEAIAEDVTDIALYKTSLEKAVMDKTTLLAELHHRVRNNLSSIIGLLSMQIRETEDKKIRRSLMEAESRILAVSSVHSLIYEGDDIVNIDFEEHMHRLLDDILESSGQKDGVRLRIAGDGLRISHWAVTDISMVAGELFTNSLKHAFPDGGGEVTVKLQKEDDNCKLTVTDNGIGIPSDFNIDSHGKLGLRITRRVVEDKLKGRLVWESEDGTEWTVLFPCSNEDLKICTPRNI